MKLKVKIVIVFLNMKASRPIDKLMNNVFFMENYGKRQKTYSNL